MNARYGRRLAALALLLALAGCGGRLVKVTGKLTYKSQPVPYTVVKFVPDDGSRPSEGMTDEQGNFTLQYSRTESGAPRGPGTVALEYGLTGEEGPPKVPKEVQAVIKKYADPKKSDLHYDITKSGQYLEIDLK
jgi:hypothetical protein